MTCGRPADVAASQDLIIQLLGPRMFWDLGEATIAQKTIMYWDGYDKQTAPAVPPCPSYNKAFGNDPFLDHSKLRNSQSNQTLNPKP